MAANEVYYIKVFSRLLGQAILNTYAYKQVTGVAALNAAQLHNLFNSFVQPHVRGIAPDTMDIDNVEVFSINNPTDFHDGPPSNTTGARAILPADMLPSYTAFGFRSNRAGAGTRSSYKRYAGMGEGDVDGNDLSAAFKIIPSVVSLTVALGTGFVGGAGEIFDPVQIKSGWLLGVPPVVNFFITSYAVPYLTSQVSRRA